jgi:hypothetical protein
MKKAYQVISCEAKRDRDPEYTGDEWTIYEGFDKNAAIYFYNSARIDKYHKIEIRVANVPDTFEFGEDDGEMIDAFTAAGWNVYHPLTEVKRYYFTTIGYNGVLFTDGVDAVVFPDDPDLNLSTFEDAQKADFSGCGAPDNWDKIEIIANNCNREIIDYNKCNVESMIEF